MNDSGVGRESRWTANHRLPIRNRETTVRRDSSAHLSPDARWLHALHRHREQTLWFGDTGHPVTVSGRRDGHRLATLDGLGAAPFP